MGAIGCTETSVTIYIRHVTTLEDGSDRLYRNVGHYLYTLCNN